MKELIVNYNVQKLNRGEFMYFYMDKIIFLDCDDKFKLISIKVTFSDNVIMCIDDPDFFKFTNFKEIIGNSIHYNISILKILPWLIDYGYDDIKFIFNYIGNMRKYRCQPLVELPFTKTIYPRMCMRKCVEDHLYRKLKINEFKLLNYYNYKNLDTINININNCKMNGVILQGIDYDNINHIFVTYNNNQKKYIKNLSLLNKKMVKLDYNTIYIPFNNSKWYKTKSRINIKNIKIQFDLVDIQKTYNVKIGLYVYNFIAKKTRHLAINNNIFINSNQSNIIVV
jgi:hypothetical protein